ncbi:MAG: diguanylate cyclase, partial [candidate division Zixibacteria bacterium]|nr:diguanylate cyclase [candidate division Zixibacteria bacterium]
IILAGSDTAGALEVARQIKDAVSNLNIPHRRSPTCKRVTVSLGLSTTIPRLSTSAESLLECADRALYDAKEGGRNKIIWRPFDPEAMRQRRIDLQDRVLRPGPVGHLALLRPGRGKLHPIGNPEDAQIR